MKIKILGSGCPTCQSLHQIVEQTIKENSIKAEVEYISGAEGIQEIVNQGIMGSPVLMIDDKVVASGNLSAEDVLNLINSSVDKVEV